jgi:hypothetical protein
MQEVAQRGADLVRCIFLDEVGATDRDRRNGSRASAACPIGAMPTRSGARHRQNGAM